LPGLNGSRAAAAVPAVQPTTAAAHLQHGSAHWLQSQSVALTVTCRRRMFRPSSSPRTPCRPYILVFDQVVVNLIKHLCARRNGMTSGVKQAVVYRCHASRSRVSFWTWGGQIDRLSSFQNVPRLVPILQAISARNLPSRYIIFRYSNYWQRYLSVLHFQRPPRHRSYRPSRPRIVLYTLLQAITTELWYTGV